MKLICPYSGTAFTSSQFLKIGDIESPHPLMLQSPKKLLLLAKDISAMSNQEEFIYFCALLKCTDHVDFLRSASYNMQVVKKNLARLIHAVGWMHVIQRESPIFFRLPRYKIDHTTHELRNIHIWLREWEAIKEDWTLQIDRQSLRKKLSSREEAIDRWVNSPYKHPIDGAKVMMAWAFAASNAPNSMKEKWLAIAGAKDKDIDMFSRDEIKDLIDYMNENLTESFGESRFHYLMKHLREQLRLFDLGPINRAFATLGETAETINNTVASDAPWRFASDDTSNLREDFKLKTLKDAPLEKPERQDFFSHIDYLKALGKFNMMRIYLEQEHNNANS